MSSECNFDGNTFIFFSEYFSKYLIGRLEFFKFTGDITTRADTLSAWLGQMLIYASVLGCEQNMVQRYLSMSSVSEVRKCVSIYYYLLLCNIKLPICKSFAIIIINHHRREFWLINISQNINGKYSIDFDTLPIAVVGWNGNLFDVF